MTERVKRLREELLKHNQSINICCEKADIVINTLKKYDAWPMVYKRAKAFEAFCDQKTIFIADGELLVGNMAAKPYSVEMCAAGKGWSDEELDEMIASGAATISSEDRKIMRSLDDYFLPGNGRDSYEQQGYFHDDERLFPWRERGVTNPAWKTKWEGVGGAGCGEGWSLNHFNSMQIPDYGMHLYTGFQAYVDQAKEERAKIRFRTKEDLNKAIFLDSLIICFEAAIRLGNRYADLAEQMAEECADPVRAQELKEISAVCRQVPAGPARTFREGMQAMTFYWNSFARGGMPITRFDMLLYPLYKADMEAGRITKEEALELIELYRLRIADFAQVWGNKTQRQKWSGLARWNNMIVGGCDRDGVDRTNELSYLCIDAAIEMQLPHPTMTVRVSKNTPEDFLLKAIECVKTGIGYPAFISEDGYIEYLTRRGIDIHDAREFAINGCLDMGLPGRSRNGGVPMFITPTILELAMHNGTSPVTQKTIGVPCGEFESFETWEAFYANYLKQAEKLIDGLAETNTIRISVEGDLYPDAYESGFYRDTLETGKDIYNRKMPFENSSAFNVVGMTNSIDSLAVIKKLVYDEKVVTAKELLAAIDANWEGYEPLRQMCLAVPKYGNNDPYVDEIGVQLWADLRKIAEQFTSPFGDPMLISAISITAHAPGGARTIATPDGRFKGENLADGGVSPHQGFDVNGPVAVLNSAMQMCQGWSCGLLNMKFNPTSFKNVEDEKKLSSMIRTYLTHGGKHVQFNVVSAEQLKDAQANAEAHRDLIVRVAGYSTYFVILTPAVQDDIISRTEHEL